LKIILFADSIEFTDY